MSVVETDQRFRITIPKEMRTKLGVTRGQKFYLVPYGDALILKRLPESPAERLGEITGEFSLDAESRRKAEQWFLAQRNSKS
ncbi:MAG: AbrB/MazE/SpoVT family DNA-binding domain-containing protein [Nitrososphaerales archaeon]|nr:AbrB/MazE/SpoVT family DNA-binding domain-containing protein [Nitrososphaerales archaeon]